MTPDVIGVRVGRNSPVLFIDSSGLTVRPGDAIRVELCGGGGEAGATVVIGTGQLLHASTGRLAGRAVRPA